MDLQDINKKLENIIDDMKYEIVSTSTSIEDLQVLKGQIAKIIREVEAGNLSDGCHSFNELYEHRMVLFSIICNQNRWISWKSKLHEDGSMFEGFFIVGIDTKHGQYTYHYKLDYWDLFKVQILNNAPKYDGHKPKDITRLFSILGG